jgi:hypothetical protein
MWSTWLCGAEPENRRFTKLFVFSAPHNVFQMNMFAGVPPGTLSPCSNHYSAILGCPRAMPTDRSRSQAHFVTPSNSGVPRSTLLRYASQLLLVAGLLPRKEAVRSRAWISHCAERWGQHQQRRGRANNPVGGAAFDQTACAWYSFWAVKNLAVPTCLSVPTECLVLLCAGRRTLGKHRP